MAGRHHCSDCGHNRDRHFLDGELGSCTRVDCVCRGYLELLHSHAELVVPGQEVIATLQRRYLHHGGWKDQA